jgi:hypothetical protein
MRAAWWIVRLAVNKARELLEQRRRRRAPPAASPREAALARELAQRLSGQAPDERSSSRARLRLVPWV